MRPNSVFQRILQGTFQLKPHNFESTVPGLPPFFTAGRLAVLRKKVLLAGLDPETYGIPPAPPRQSKAVLFDRKEKEKTLAKY